MKKTIVVLLSCILHLYCNAQSFDQLDIRFFNEEQGLSYNDTRCFYQDSKGFLWIGTTYGLNRYDGNSIKVYLQHHGDKNSLPGNNIISITGDDSTGLWVYTFEGIVHFFPNDEKAIDYTEGILNGKKQSIAGTVGKIFYDAKHTLCLINDLGISFFDKQQNVFVLHKIFPPGETIQFTRITDYYQEDKNTLLLLGYNGVIRYNITTHQYHYIKATLDYFKIHPAALMSFIKNDDAKFWITTSCYGLIIIDEKTNVAQSFLIDNKITNRNLQNILFFIEKPTKGIFKNDIVIGNAGYGLYVVKPEEQNNFQGFKKIDNSNNLTDKEKAKNLSTNYCFYTDRNNITYIGGGGGVFSVNPTNQIFKKYNNQFGGFVSGIIKKYTPDKKLRYYFSSFYSGGLYIFDEHLKKVKSYPHVPPEVTTSQSTSVNCLYKDDKNQLWVGTNIGLYLYDDVQDKFKSLLSDKKNPNSIKYDRISCIMQDHNGIFWIGLSPRGFECFDASRNIFYNLNLQTPCNDNSYVFNIIEDAENNIWIGRDKGIVKINSARNKFSEYNFSKDDSTGISNDEAQCFLLDRQKRLWIGTKNGLNLYLPKTNTFKKYFRENGLGSDFIYSLAQDINNNIWVGVTYSVCILNPTTDKIIVYKNIGAAIINCDSDGKVIIGSGGPPINFVTCSEKAIRQDSILPLPYITNLKITGEDKALRNVSTQNLNDIKLGYKENYLTFDFTGVSYNDAYLNQFKCKLEGLETKWNETGKVRSISYAALEPGDYDFRLMCCNGNGIWNPKIASLHISIRPPWWQTWWFRLFLILFFASGAYYVYLQRIKAVRAEENIKTKLAQLETQALMAQMNPHFIFNALNSIQACIVSNNNDAAYKYLNKFSILVRSILQNSREAFILLSNELDVLKNYLELEQLRFKDLDFRINLSTEVNSNNFKVPSSFMQPFVENAIIHGLAHKTGEKMLEINITKSDDALLFKIKDNGIGRKKSAELNLKRTRSHTSMGMSIVESRLKLINEQYHSNAEIKINDLTDLNEIAVGTEVILILPLSIQEELF